MKLVDTPPGLDAVAADLAGAERVYVDTEFESNRGGTTLSVIQLSRGGDIHLVDALRLRALDPLREVLGREGVEWVLHAGLQDVELLMDALRLKRRPTIFDTQVGWGLTSAEHSASLAYLVYRVLGTKTMKSHQADDWKRRPLPKAQLEYAAQDVESLPAIRDHLEKRLHELDREVIALRATEDQLWPSPDPPSTVRIESFRNAWQLDVESQAALRFLIDWYGELDDAERRDAPSPKSFLNIASRLPETGKDLARIKGIPRRWAQKHGDGFTGRLMRATRSPKDDFQPLEPPPYATFPELRVEAWLGLARAEICAELSAAPDLALPNKILRRMKDAALDAGDLTSARHELHGWRDELFGDAFVEYCRRNGDRVDDAFE